MLGYCRSEVKLFVKHGHTPHTPQLLYKCGELSSDVPTSYYARKSITRFQKCATLNNFSKRNGVRQRGYLSLSEMKWEMKCSCMPIKRKGQIDIVFLQGTLTHGSFHFYFQSFVHQNSNQLKRHFTVLLWKKGISSPRTEQHKSEDCVCVSIILQPLSHAMANLRGLVCMVLYSINTNGFRLLMSHDVCESSQPISGYDRRTMTLTLAQTYSFRKTENVPPNFQFTPILQDILNCLTSVLCFYMYTYV